MLTYAYTILTISSTLISPTALLVRLYSLLASAFASWSCLTCVFQTQGWLYVFIFSCCGNLFDHFVWSAGIVQPFQRKVDHRNAGGRYQRDDCCCDKEEKSIQRLFGRSLSLFLCVDVVMRNSYISTIFDMMESEVERMVAAVTTRRNSLSALNLVLLIALGC